MSQADWLQWQARHSAPTASQQPIVRIEIDGGGRLASDFLRERITQKPGEPLNREELEADLKRIYGLGYYEIVSYSTASSPDGTILTIRVQEKSWGRTTCPSALITKTISMAKPASILPLHCA